MAEFNINDLKKSLRKDNPFGDSLANSTFSRVTEYIHTGNFHLNAVMSGSLFGGIPNNRSICLAGESGTGKTFLLLNLCREAQQMGYEIIYYDTEGAVDIDTATNFGIDPDKFEHQPISDLNVFRTSITKAVKQLIEAKSKGLDLPKVMFCLDSLGMLATDKEINDAISGSDKADMTRAKTIRSIFRIITSDLTGIGCPFIFTNHTYASTSMFPTINLSGGGGLVYSASVILALMKAKLKDDRNDGKLQTGIVVTAKTLKNRFAKPFDIKFHIHYTKGMNPYIGLENYLGWDKCGIEKGNIISEKDYEKLSDDKKQNARPIKTEDGDQYFYPKDTARNYICEHLGYGVSIRELFSGEVFTHEVLTRIDENLIKPKFSYSDNTNITAEIDDLLSSEELENE